MNKKFLLLAAFISLNAGAALFADEGNDEPESTEAVAQETANAEESQEAAPQKGCGCPHAK